MSKKSRKQDIDFLGGAGKCVDKIDFYLEEFNKAIQTADKLKATYNLKENMFCGSNGLIVYLALTIVIAVIACFASDIFGFYGLIASPIIASVIYVLLKKKYNSKYNKLKNEFNEAYEELRKKAEKSFIAIKAMEPDYNVYKSDINETAYHIIAIEIMYEAIRQGYCDTIEDAYIFYQRRRNYMEKCKNKKIKNLIPIIKNSENLLEKRNVFFDKYKTKEDILAD